MASSNNEKLGGNSNRNRTASAAGSSTAQLAAELVDEFKLKNASTSPKPTRPLSAYNLFFRVERARILNGEDDAAISPHEIIHLLETSTDQKEKRKHKKTHGKISFIELARVIADRWNNLDDQIKYIFEGIAGQKKAQYKKELKAWKAGKKLPSPATTIIEVMKLQLQQGAVAGINDESSLPQAATSSPIATGSVHSLGGSDHSSNSMNNNKRNFSDVLTMPTDDELNPHVIGSSSHHTAISPMRRMNASIGGDSFEEEQQYYETLWDENVFLSNNSNSGNSNNAMNQRMRMAMARRRMIENNKLLVQLELQRRNMDVMVNGQRSNSDTNMLMTNSSHHSTTSKRRCVSLNNSMHGSSLHGSSHHSTTRKHQVQHHDDSLSGYSALEAAARRLQQQQQDANSGLFMDETMVENTGYFAFPETAMMMNNFSSNNNNGLFEDQSTMVDPIAATAFYTGQDAFQSANRAIDYMSAYYPNYINNAQQQGQQQQRFASPTALHRRVSLPSMPAPVSLGNNSNNNEINGARSLSLGSGPSTGSNSAFAPATNNNSLRSTSYHSQRMADTKMDNNWSHHQRGDLGNATNTNSNNNNKDDDCSIYDDDTCSVIPLNEHENINENDNSTHAIGMTPMPTPLPDVRTTSNINDLSYVSRAGEGYGNIL